MEATELAALYEAWASRLLAYMMTITRDRHLAEDALQNLFVKLAASRPELRDPAVYLFRAARNEAVRLSRRSRGEGSTPLEIIAPRAGAEPPVETSTLSSALDLLPGEQAEVVILHALEDLTFREIAQILRIPADTAASRYRYGIERLRSLLGSWISKTS